MAETILEYLKKTADVTLKDHPLNEVDSLILCQFSYLKFDGILPGLGHRDKAITLLDIYEHENYDAIYADERYRKNNTALFERMLDSRRFNRMKIHSYVNIIEQENETQFAALTVEFEDGTTYVVFRGTDDNLVGWKEDLNLALSKPIPGQIRSVEYLDDVAKYLPDKFYVGGHSKGGNLSVFSAMYCSEATRNRIIAVFNHDGPGLRNEIMDDKRYMDIRDRIKMYVPRSSLVGMLLINYDDYKVVDSKYIGLLQHDPYGWKVKDYGFVFAHEVKEYAALRDRSINEWVMSLGQDQIEVFVDSVYDVMLATEAETLNDIIADWKIMIPKVKAALDETDEETKAILSKMLWMFIEIAGENTQEELNVKFDEFKSYISELSDQAKTYTQIWVETAKNSQEIVTDRLAEIKPKVAAKKKNKKDEKK